MTRGKLMIVGQHLRSLLTEWELDSIEVTRGAERIRCERGPGFKISVDGGEWIEVPEAAYETRYEVVE